MRLAFLDNAAIGQCRPDVAGELTWVGIIGVDHVSDLTGERDEAGGVDGGVLGNPQAPVAEDEGRPARIREPGPCGVAPPRVPLFGAGSPAPSGTSPGRA